MLKGKQKSYFSSTRTNELPSLDKFKKNNFMILEPNQIDCNKKKNDKNDLIFTKETYLNANCAHYLNIFSDVSKNLIEEKFKKLNSEINTLLSNLMTNPKVYETFFHSLILNTDQNEDMFFTQLEEYFRKKDYQIEKLYDYSFNDVKSLFKHIFNENSEDKTDAKMDIDKSYPAKKVNILLIIAAP